MSAELPLSTRILLVLNPSMFNIITNGSLWGYFTPLTSASLKNMSWSIRLCLSDGTIWTLFTCLWHAFLRDLNDPPVMGPPAIVFISLGREFKGREFTLILVSPLKLLYSPFFTYFCNFPFHISSSIHSFKSWQSSV